MNTKSNKTNNSFATALFLTDSSSNIVNSNSIFIPQNIKLRQNIGYSAKSGVIAINDAGEYYVSFCISAANTSGFEDIIAVSFKQLTPSSIIIATSAYTTVNLQKSYSLTGCAIFTATAGSTYAFINSSKAAISISPNKLAETNITIFRIN